ncbi:hypothetical protein [Paludifilum halophilum]|nr:hypothetical protein [Paludifilum halophilum]
MDGRIIDETMNSLFGSIENGGRSTQTDALPLVWQEFFDDWFK